MKLLSNWYTLQLTSVIDFGKSWVKFTESN